MGLLAKGAYCTLLLCVLVIYSSSLTSASPACNRKLYAPPWQLRSDQITILMSGFAEKRLSLLKQIARSYSVTPIVHSIYILWGNTSTPWALLNHTDLVSLGAPVYVVRQQTTSLNDRFLPRTYIQTRAVLICDDDITIDLDELKFAFHMWKENDRRIVGFFPRSHEYQLQLKTWIYTIHPDRYSIMLTKLMILSTEYLYQYTCAMPPGVKEYIDSNMNCEDIAMNFVVANLTNQGPLLVNGKPRDWGDTRNSMNDLSSSALSAKKQHRKNRGDCITVFHQLWEGMPLRYSFGKAVNSVEEQVFCEKHGSLLPCNDQSET
ncbi:hypothetical protein L7F22_048699 [Adiantum nelumboides]|nr:hypothetical protein [Adiantum nelumboides]